MRFVQLPSWSAWANGKHGDESEAPEMWDDLVACYAPVPSPAVYHCTKSFVDSFSYALRHELKDSGVTVTCIMPGATET